ncbi:MULTISPECIES: Dps family protein [Kordiimonas]|jgi:starvation-inducible DNA-binding protein|uniref:Starvation-inducible DNA-binding protein n=1 Tax=Kordiimonas lacus TaxID=637679 RepID=A0A1G7AAQ9_9PROT|nr:MULTISPECIES: DNA starvation/stationary phase protection protein [Kordiimonas]SDE11912.1 starvation-inducible DNA-binding protein [Kordiimonas lacus]
MSNTAQVFATKAHDEKIDTGIRERDTSKLAQYLSNALADSYILYLQTQGVHWNVVGPAFYGLHKLTETQYEDLAEAIDSIAERIRALGHPAPASFSEFEENSILTSEPGVATTEEFLRKLVDGNTSIADRMRKSVAAAEEIDDVYTADLLTARIGAHEEAAWMYRSLLAQ